MSEPGRRRVYAEDAAPPRRWTAFRVGWLAILGFTLATRVTMLQSWSWLQDDLLLTSWVPTYGFGEYVLKDVAGHVLTGEMLIAWTFTKLDPLDYTWPALTICVFSALVVIGWGLALREIFGERLHLLLALVVLNLTPGMTVISLWWISCLNVFPMLASMGFAVWFLARYLLREQSRWDLVGMNLSYALGLLMWEKSLLVSIPLFFLVFLLGPPTVRLALPVAVRLLWPTALLSLAYLGFYAWSIHGSPPGAPRTYPLSAGAALEFLSHGTADTTLPALIGGPFGTIESSLSAFSKAPTALAFVLWAAALALAIVGIQFRRRGGVALAMILTYTAVSWGLVFFSARYGSVGPGILGIPRYSADVLPVALLGCLYLVTPARGEDAPLRRPVTPQARGWIRRALIGHLVAASVLALITTGRLWDALEPSSTKPYMDNLVGDARRLGDASIFDTNVPQELVIGVFLPDASRVSSILGPLDLPLRYNEPAEQLLITDAQGHLRGAAVSGGVTHALPGPDGDCGFAVDAGEVTEIPLSGELFSFEWGVEITYFTGSDAKVAVRTDQVRAELDIPENPAGEVGRIQLVLPGKISRFSIEGLSGDASVCVTEVRIGTVEATDQVPKALREKAHD